MYHDALWLLYTVRDDLAPPSGPYIDDDRSTIDTCTRSLLSIICLLTLILIGITRTKLRYHRCQARAIMPEGARRKDAQADQNLDDVNRFPPPWDLQPLPDAIPSSR
jgi:serine/threonine-protein kinase ULK2